MAELPNEKTDSLEKAASGTENEAGIDLCVDPAKEGKLLAKLDLAVTPIIMLIYLSCFLDRSNIGKSRLLE